MTNALQNALRSGVTRAGGCPAALRLPSPVGPANHGSTGGGLHTGICPIQSTQSTAVLPPSCTMHVFSESSVYHYLISRDGKWNDECAEISNDRRGLPDARDAPADLARPTCVGAVASESFGIVFRWWRVVWRGERPLRPPFGHVDRSAQL